MDRLEPRRPSRPGEGPAPTTQPGLTTYGVSRSNAERLGPGQPSTPPRPIYVPQARYSLPLELPQGQVRKDFTHPSGDASIVLYAVRNDLVQSAYATAAILAMLVVVYLGRYIYRYLKRA